MILSINSFIDLQRQSFLAEFSNRMDTCLIATTRERLRDHSDLFNWQISNLKGTRGNSALVVSRKDRDESSLIPALWVASSYTNYRDAFKKYLNHYFGCYVPCIPSHLQVDHLHSRHRFKPEHEPYFFRLALIDRNTNTSFGAGFERKFYSRERDKEPNGGFHMDWLAFLKIYGAKLPSSRLNESEFSKWCWNIAKRIHHDGIEDPVLAYHGISLMYNLGFNDRYQPYKLPDSAREEAQKYSGYYCVPPGEI